MGFDFERIVYCWSKIPLYSHGRDAHQLYSRSLYIPTMKGGMTIPNIRSLDPGTFQEYLRSRRSKHLFSVL